MKRLERLEYHQQLLLRLADCTKEPFTYLIIKENLGPEEILEFHSLCDDLSKKMEKQKAEGFLYFHPLLKEFSQKLNRKLDVKEVITSCIQQNLHTELMTELQKYLMD